MNPYALLAYAVFMFVSWALAGWLGYDYGSASTEREWMAKYDRLVAAQAEAKELVAQRGADAAAEARSEGREIAIALEEQRTQNEYLLEDLRRARLERRAAAGDQPRVCADVDGVRDYNRAIGFREPAAEPGASPGRPDASGPPSSPGVAASPAQ